MLLCERCAPAADPLPTSSVLTTFPTEVVSVAVLDGRLEKQEVDAAVSRIPRCGLECHPPVDTQALEIQRGVQVLAALYGSKAAELGVIRSHLDYVVVVDHPQPQLRQEPSGGVELYEEVAVSAVGAGAGAGAGPAGVAARAPTGVGQSVVVGAAIASPLQPPPQPNTDPSDDWDMAAMDLSVTMPERPAPARTRLRETYTFTSTATARSRRRSMEHRPAGSGTSKRVTAADKRRSEVQAYLSKPSKVVRPARSANWGGTRRAASSGAAIDMTARRAAAVRIQAVARGRADRKRAAGRIARWRLLRRYAWDHIWTQAAMRGALVPGEIADAHHGVRQPAAV